MNIHSFLITESNISPANNGDMLPRIPQSHMGLTVPLHSTNLHSSLTTYCCSAVLHLTLYYHPPQSTISLPLHILLTSTPIPSPPHPHPSTFYRSPPLHFPSTFYSSPPVHFPTTFCCSPPVHFPSTFCSSSPVHVPSTLFYSSPSLHCLSTSHPNVPLDSTFYWSPPQSTSPFNLLYCL